MNALKKSQNTQNGILGLIFISLTFGLINFKSLNMNAGYPATLLFIKYEDITRYKSWKQIAQEEQDIFFCNSE